MKIERMYKQREQFENEWNGDGAQNALKIIKRFSPEKYWELYSKWLEQRNAEMVEASKRLVEGYYDTGEVATNIRGIEQALKNNGAL